MSFYDLSMFDMHPKADGKYVVQGEKYRITVLTERMLRLEYSESGRFEDRATRFAFNRAFDTPEFDVYREDGILHVVTKHLHVRYDEKKFTDYGMQIYVDGTCDWSYGKKCNTMLGTTRTLDGANGPKPLGEGFITYRDGFYAYDDSKTIAIGADGWPVPVTDDRIDLYFFGYNKDYEQCIKDFYKLTNPVPLLPRFALGNWWSRYHAYTDREYYKLLDDFKAKNLPFSVAVIDMDWHITKTPDEIKYGAGWTGYTWNKELFPSPKEFLSELHRRGLRTTLNLHPRDGVRAYEDLYPALCKRLGKDATDGKQIEFDASDRTFMEAYYDTVIRSLEDEGVDFWWIDWQQTGGKREGGYDVLWMLNHCHYVDSARRGERPLTFSRYAEPGSHRYPVGFSGDTHVSWESLGFQPYFTATAANVGYSWWSHDIGGHVCGSFDEELQSRWVQFGVFSPIMRLHSTCNPFISKEPWNYGDYEGIISDFLRLRHRLVPYIYTMMYRGTEEGIPMVRPIYHKYPDDHPTYKLAHTRTNPYLVKSEYLFGDMIVSPIVSKKDPESGLGKTKVWLPNGTYIDFFNGRVYNGHDSIFDVYRNDSEIPVFVKSGSVIPLAVLDGGNGVENPSALEICVFGGDDGEFIMVEDNGKTGSAARVARTKYSFEYGSISALSFTALACESVPEVRDYSVKFYAFSMPSELYAEINGERKPLEFEYDGIKHIVTASVGSVRAGDSVRVVLCGDGEVPRNELDKTVFEMLRQAGIKNDDKVMLNHYVTRRDIPTSQKIQELYTKDVNGHVRGALVEILCADEK